MSHHAKSSFEILNKQTVGDGIRRLEIQARDIARKAKPGQFVMVMADEFSERVALSIIDMIPEKGIITVVFDESGRSACKLGSLKIGDTLFSVLGPLGSGVPVDGYGAVACIGHAVGIAQILPICRILKRYDNKVIGILGAENKGRLILENHMRLSCHKIFMTTDDGSYSQRGSVTHALRELLAQQDVHCVYAVGPMPILEDICHLTKSKRIKTFVNIQTRMVDGIGICGACRLRVNETNVLACTCGPFFNGHQVDFSDLKVRLQPSQKHQPWQSSNLFNPLKNGSKTFLKSLWG